MAISFPAVAQDVVLVGGRVMDPETGLDALRNVEPHLTRPVR